MTPIDRVVALFDLAAGLALLGAGWSMIRRGGRGKGIMIIVAGVAWFGGTIAGALAVAHRPPLVAGLFSHGARRSRLGSVAVVMVGFVAAVVSVVWQRDIVTLLLGLALVSHSFETSSAEPPLVGRRACRAFGALLAIMAITQLFGARSGPSTALAYSSGVIGVALLLALDRTQPTADRLAIDLASLPFDGSLVDRLRFALGDPRLQLIIGPDDTLMVGGLSAVPLIRSGRVVGMLHHDPAVPLQPTLLDGVAAIVGLAADARDLRVVAHGTLTEIDRSSRLLADARRHEAAELARQVEHGPIAHLERAKRHVTDGSLAEQLDIAVSELREVTEGLALARLDAAGLGVALMERAEASPVPVELEIDALSLPGPVARAVFLVCCEALVNAIKHADARCIRVRVKSSMDQLVAEVCDDGHGGADPAGSGFRGLAERAAVLGGRLTVESPAGGGTTVHLTIPVTWNPA